MRQFMQIVLCQLVLGLNVRSRPGEEDELRRLGESAIRRLIHPIITRPDKLVVDGTRRVLGMRLVLGENSDHPVDCLMTDELLSDAEIIEINLVSAIHRKGLDGYEQYQGCLTMQKLHPEWQLQDLAAALNLDAGHMTKLLSPGKCGPEWLRALQMRRVTISDCYAASRTTADERHAMLVAKLNGASRDDLERQAKKARSVAKHEVKSSRVKIAIAGGSAVVTGEQLGMAELAEIFVELSKDARKAVGVYDIRTWEKMRQDRFASKAPKEAVKETANGQQA